MEFYSKRLLKKYYKLFNFNSFKELTQSNPFINQISIKFINDKLRTLKTVDRRSTKKSLYKNLQTKKEFNQQVKRRILFHIMQIQIK